jgi:REP element-mobilizing transposase RayT
MADDNHTLPKRRSPRLKDYDYSQDGGYFVTICTQNRVCLFGDVADGVMRLNDAGKMVVVYWEEATRKFPGLILDAAIVMPNHMHGIIFLPGSISLLTVIQWFKTMTTNAYIRGVKRTAGLRFPIGCGRNGFTIISSGMKKPRTKLPNTSITTRCNGNSTNITRPISINRL